MQAFRDGARDFAGNVRTSFADGTNPDVRQMVWQAADIFTSLPDNIQETFGLVIVEAMASGLPVVASDWNGYRDMVLDGETGFLVPTYTVEGATWDTSVRLQLESVEYDYFLAECSQAVTVDCLQAARAFERLVRDRALRLRLGSAARERALACYGWPKVIKAYEELWNNQEKVRQDHIRLASATGANPRRPVRYPPPERAFAHYPTRWLKQDDQVEVAPAATDRLALALTMPLLNHVPYTRSTDVKSLQAALACATGSTSLGALEQALRQTGMKAGTARATLAWLLKYDLLRVTSYSPASARPGTP